MQLLEGKVLEEVRYWLHYKPNREESLVARIQEITYEIEGLTKIQEQYITELEQLRRENNGR